jgi:hypothetical protein
MRVEVVVTPLDFLTPFAPGAITQSTSRRIRENGAAVFVVLQRKAARLVNRTK